MLASRLTRLTSLLALALFSPCVFAATPAFTLVSTTPTTFASTTLGQSSSVQNIQVTTTRAVTISSVSIAASVGSKQEFVLGTVSGCTTNGSASTASGTTCTIPVTFTPAYPGVRNQTLSITDSTGLVFTVGLSGTATGPQGILMPGTVSTTGGIGGGYNYTGDGGAVGSATFSAPYNIYLDASSNLYLADEVSGNVRVVYQGGASLACLIEIENPAMFGLASGTTSCAGATSAPVAGYIYTIGGDPTQYSTTVTAHVKGSDDNRLATAIAATTGTLNSPAGVAVDGYGNVVIADYNAYKIRVIFSGGSTMSCLIEINNPTLFGLSSGATSCSGATSAPVPGYIYTLIGGTGTSTAGASGDGGLGNSALMTYAAAVAISPSGDIYFLDDSTQSARTSRLRVIYAGGATTAALITAENPTVTSPQIGYVYKIAGGTFASTGDGALASSGGLLYGRGLVMDADGNLLFTDESTTSGSQTAKIRVVYVGGTRMASLIALENAGATAKLGYIYTIAGYPTSGATGSGYSGDGGLATAALMTLPYSLTLDPAGDIYISDYSGYRIRKVSTYDGTINTYAGNGTHALLNGNALTVAELYAPYGIGWASNGVLYFSEPSVYRIRQISNTAAAITFTTAAPVGNQSETEVVYETNVGTSAMTLSAITPSTNFGVVASGSTLYSDCTSTTVLQPGQTCAIGVAMVPTTGGTLTGTLTVTDNSLGSSTATQTVSLTGTSAIQTATALTTSSTNADLGSTITFTATVTTVAGQNTTGAATLTGSVAFTNTSTNPITTLGTVAIDPTTGVAAVQTSSLAAGTSTIKATFTPTAGIGYSGSSATLTQVVTAPALTIVTTTPGVAVVTGQTTTASFTITSVGGYAGSIAASCNSLSANVTCSFSPSTTTVSGNGTKTVTLTIGTTGSAALTHADRNGIEFAGLFGTGLLLCLVRRKRLPMLLAGLMTVTLAMGITGCSSTSTTASRGTFNVNAVFTDGTTTTTIPITVSVLGK